MVNGPIGVVWAPRGQVYRALAQAQPVPLHCELRTFGCCLWIARNHGCRGFLCMNGQTLLSYDICGKMHYQSVHVKMCASARRWLEGAAMRCVKYTNPCNDCLVLGWWTMQSACLCFLGVGFEGVKQQGLGETRPADSESVLPFCRAAAGALTAVRHGCQ